MAERLNVHGLFLDSVGVCSISSPISDRLYSDGCGTVVGSSHYLKKAEILGEASGSYRVFEPFGAEGSVSC